MGPCLCPPTTAGGQIQTQKPSAVLTGHNTAQEIIRKKIWRTRLGARTIKQQTHHNRMKADVKVHLSGVWMEGAPGCLNAGMAHVGISCMSGDCQRQHGKTQNRSASQMFRGRTGDLCLTLTNCSRPTFQLFFTALYFSIYHLRLGRAEITQITFILRRVF